MIDIQISTLYFISRQVRTGLALGRKRDVTVRSTNAHACTQHPFCAIDAPARKLCCIAFLSFQVGCRILDWPANPSGVSRLRPPVSGHQAGTPRSSRKVLQNPLRLPQKILGLKQLLGPSSVLCLPLLPKPHTAGPAPYAESVASCRHFAYAGLGTLLQAPTHRSHGGLYEDEYHKRDEVYHV